MRCARRFLARAGSTFAAGLALASAACGDSPGADRASTLIVPSGERDWGTASNFDTDYHRLLFLPLVDRAADGSFEPRLARSWEHSPDYRTWTVSLRTDVRWDDGHPTTAHDVAFTLELARHPAIGLAAPDAYEITVLDDSTYTIAYRKPSIGSPWDDDTVYWPKHLLEGLDPEDFERWEFWKRPVGNGSYRYVRHVPMTMAEFEARRDFYAGEPRIQRVVVVLGNPGLPDLLAGHIDVLDVTPAQLPKLAADPRFRVYHYPTWFNVRAIVWNHRHPPFADARVRRALTLALDRATIRSDLDLPEELPVSDAPFSGRQYAARETGPALSRDTAEARRLLLEAGWRREGDVLVKEGRPFRFDLLVAGPLGVSAGTLVREQLRRVGVQADLVAMDGGALLERLRSSRFTAALTNTGTSLEGEFELPFLFGRESVLGYRNERVVELLDAAARTWVPEEDDAIYRELQMVFRQDLPVTYLFPNDFPTVAHRRVRGLSSPFRTAAIWYADRLWIDDRSSRR